MAESIYSTPSAMLTSMLRDGFLHKKYSAWRAKFFDFMPHGRLYYSKIRGVQRDCYLFDISEVKLEKITIKIESDSLLGITVRCKKDNLKTSFRCIIPSEKEFEDFCNAFRKSSTSHNIDSFRALVLQNSPFKDSGNTYLAPKKGFVGLLNDAETKAVKDSIKKNRGAFLWMPALFRNDLVHGSWWFVFGSVFITAASVVTLINKFQLFLGDDDSTLTAANYNISWELLIASGGFFTVGSLAFVRAMSDPPMKPMFSWYHFSTDELFGSWMFTIATAPAIPWSLIYLAEYHTLTYLGLLGISILAVLGCLLFVFACYPTGTDHHKKSAYILPYLLRFCCRVRKPTASREEGGGGQGDIEASSPSAGASETGTGAENDEVSLVGASKWEIFVRKHCASDWLLGTWIVFWATLVATIVFLLYTLYAFQYSNTVTDFVNVTTTLDCVWFLIGSIYFVSGSYDTKNDDDETKATGSSQVINIELTENPMDTSTSESTPKSSRRTSLVAMIALPGDSFAAGGTEDDEDE